MKNNSSLDNKNERKESSLEQSQLETMPQRELEEWIWSNNGIIEFNTLQNIVKKNENDIFFLTRLLPIFKFYQDFKGKIDKEIFFRILPSIESKEIQLNLLNRWITFYADKISLKELVTKIALFEPDNKAMAYTAIISWLEINDNSKSHHWHIGHEYAENFKKLVTFFDSDTDKLKVIKILNKNIANNSFNIELKTSDLEFLQSILMILGDDNEEKIKIIVKFLGNINYSLESNQKIIREILPLFNNNDDRIKIVRSVIHKANNFCSQIFYSTIDLVAPNENLRKAFIKFPIIREAIRADIWSLNQLKNFPDVDLKLPTQLQEAINIGNDKAIAEYYGIAVPVLMKIQTLDCGIHKSRPLYSHTIVEMIKSGWINADNFLLIDKIKKDVEKEQQPNVLHVIIRACVILAIKLGFNFDNNNLKSYPEFLENLLKNTLKKSPNGLIESAQSLTEGSLPTGIEDAVDDYIKTVFLPYHLQGKENYDIDKELIEFRLQTINLLFEDVSLEGICKFSNRWHDPRKLAQLNKAKTFSDSKWVPLFSADSLSYKVKDGIKDVDIKIVPLTTSEELTKEGKDLNHCVGSYAKKCLLESSHIISLRNESGESLSTIELQLEKGKGDTKDKNVINIEGETNYHLKVRQHHGRSNNAPLDKCESVAKLFFDDLRSGKIKIDLQGLEEERLKRDKIHKDPNKRAMAIIGYDPKDKEALEKAITIYREHGLNNGEKKKAEEEVKEEAVIIHLEEAGTERKDPQPPKLKDITVPKQLTRNFDKLTGKTKEKEESKEQNEEFKSDIKLFKIDKKPLMAIKDHIVRMLKDQDSEVFLKKNVNVTPSSKNDKIFINILTPLSDGSLVKLKDILGDKAILASNEEKSEKVHTALIIELKDLSDTIKILQEKAPLPVKGDVVKAKASKLEGSENKDHEH